MDELTALRGLYPEPAPPAPPVTQRHREAVMTLIAEAEQNQHTPVRHRRRRRRAATLIAVPVMVAVLAAAGWAVMRGDATEAAAFACVGDNVTAVLPNDGTPPVEACERLWETGRMDPTHAGTAPPLVACVAGAGTIEVIAADSDSACDARGMAPWAGEDSYTAVGAAVREARISLHDRYQRTGDGCATVDDWRDLLAPHLTEAGWTVSAKQVAPDRRCYDVGSLKPVDKQLVLVGVPGDFSISCDPRTGC